VCSAYLVYAATNASAGPPTRFGALDDARLANSAAEPGQWFTGGRDAQGTYYSPLDQINAGNVTNLGFAWEYRLGTYRGLEATPVVVDGVLYSSGNLGLVYALDAQTGKKIWTFDPQIKLQSIRYACCDIVNRGVAVRNGLVFVGSLDGRLFALDAATGKPKWSADTIVDHKLPHTLTGAPQLTKDLVVIGNSGADMNAGAVRGYVSAYDQKTGAFRWRFYTVPDVSEKNPTPELAAAEKTWDPHRRAGIFGGGTVWDGTAYDPDLNLVYFGTGNAAPYEKSSRGRGGDNLYAASIVALHADTGRMAWYYQTVPGDVWDYDNVQKFILADLTIGGKPRKVIMQAPKDGYFYVIDRATGEVISAKPYAHLNWSKGMDAHFRPIIDPQADYSHQAKVVFPSYEGAHSWQPMSYDPKTGLVYLPVLEEPMVVTELRNTHSSTQFIDDEFGSYIAIPDITYDVKADEAMFGPMPNFKVIDPKTGRPIMHTMMKAWNPVTQTEAWATPVTEGYRTFEGGAMSTAGNLVFQGTSTGELRVYAADTGKLLHTIQTGTGIMAAPATYTIDGTQYVAVMAGYGGDALSSPPPPFAAHAHYDNEGRILAFRLGGAHDVPRTAERVVQPLAPPPPKEGTDADIAEGGKLFNTWCARCHHAGSVLIPDLRRLQDGIGQLDTFKQVVLEGIFAAGGMERFDDILKPHDAEMIHAYLIDQARNFYAAENAKRQ
jgi:quinohemoprotein ethanol dehydrogenase